MALKANELRIGNWHWGDGNPIQITAKDILDLSDDPQDDFYQPIPLTEEWLLKFGFSSKDYKKGFIGIDHKCGGMITDFVLRYPLQMGEWQLFFVWPYSDYRFNKLEFVHELQNLFFALTGEELEMKQF